MRAGVPFLTGEETFVELFRAKYRGSCMFGLIWAAWNGNFAMAVRLEAHAEGIPASQTGFSFVFWVQGAYKVL